MSVGEEALNDSMYSARTENCFAETDAAILCIERDSWILTREKLLFESYNSPRRRGSTTEQLIKDILFLDEILRFNYYNKKKKRDRKAKDSRNTCNIKISTTGKTRA